MKAQFIILDPSDVRETVLQGIAAIERGDFIELKGDAELKELANALVVLGP